MFHIFSKKENAKVNWCDFYYFILLHFPVVRQKNIKETKYVGIPGLLCNPIKNLIKAPIWNGYGTLSLSDRRRKKQTSSSASMKPSKQPKLGISMLRKSNLLSKLFYNPITWWWLYLHCNQRLFLLLNLYLLNGEYFQFQRILIKHWLIFATQQTKKLHRKSETDQMEHNNQKLEFFSNPAKNSMSKASCKSSLLLTKCKIAEFQCKHRTSTWNR